MELIIEAVLLRRPGGVTGSRKQVAGARIYLQPPSGSPEQSWLHQDKLPHWTKPEIHDC